MPLSSQPNSRYSEPGSTCRKLQPLVSQRNRRAAAGTIIPHKSAEVAMKVFELMLAGLLCEEWVRLSDGSCWNQRPAASFREVVAASPTHEPSQARERKIPTSAKETGAPHDDSLLISPRPQGPSTSLPFSLIRPLRFSGLQKRIVYTPEHVMRTRAH